MTIPNTTMKWLHGFQKIETLHNKKMTMDNEQVHLLQYKCVEKHAVHTQWAGMNLLSLEIQLWYTEISKD